MTRKVSFLRYLFVMLACIVPLTMLLGIAAHGQLEYIINCILSTEVITPALIVGVTLIIFFARKVPGT
jgi:hypothetical protein